VIPKLNTHASIATVAVKIINIQALANTTDVAMWTVIDILVGVIVVKFTCTAEILCEFNPAFPTFLINILDSFTFHAHDLFNIVAVEFVVRIFVVTKAASIYLPTAWSNDLTLPSETNQDH